MTQHIYEAVDTTDDEQYWTYGLWLSLDDAITAIESIDDPTDLGYPAEDAYNYCRVEIRQRDVGFCDSGKCYVLFEWSDEPDGDDYKWERTRTDYPRGEWCP